MGDYLTSACLGFLVPLFEESNVGLAQYPVSNEAEKFGSSCDLN